MPKLPRATSKETIKALERLGFIKIRQKGSHVIMRRQSLDSEKQQVSCVVPLHNKTLATGTLRNILNQACISIEDFTKSLNS